jgi:predicted alpha/beta-fold hydrolase
LVHGLTGSHRSKYLVRLARRFVKQGIMTFRMNLRGCGTGRGLARNLYHSGRSEDVRAVLHWISAQYPSNPITVIGFSLGANIILKMAGEAEVLPDSLTSFMAVSPPLSLYRSVKLLTHRANKIFNDHFVKELIKDARYRQQLFPEIKAPVYSKTMTVYDFDDVYTAPLSGYLNARDYYARCSSNQFIHNIRHPKLILGAIDDPVISRYDYLKLPHKDNLDVILTRQGGHVGWLARAEQNSGVRWMDDVLTMWHSTMKRSDA